MFRSERILWVYGALNVFLLVVWGLLTLEWLPLGYLAVADIGAPLGLLAAFFLIPLVAFWTWWKGRTASAELSSRRRPYFALSRLFWLLTWFVSCLPIAFFSALYVETVQPWPLSLRQGPNTAYARDIFERDFGFPPEGSVYDLYARTTWMGPGDGNLYQIRFAYADEGVVDRIIEVQQLVPVDPTELPYADPGWWTAGKAYSFDSVYGVEFMDAEGKIRSAARLYVDFDRQVVFYHSP